MVQITEIHLSPVPVMYAAGDSSKPIPVQAPEAFTELEGKLLTFKKRRFYGVILKNEYRACTSLLETDDPDNLPHASWIIPGGKYCRTRIRNWRQHTQLIGPTFDKLYSRLDADYSRPGIEYYRSQIDLFVMVPVKD